MYNFLGISNFYGIRPSVIAKVKENGQFGWLASLLQGINYFLYPLLVAVVAAGAIYSVMLGINLVRAETSEKREEAKKRLTWAIIGLVSIFILILVMELVANNIDSIVPGIRG